VSRSENHPEIPESRVKVTAKPLLVIISSAEVRKERMRAAPGQPVKHAPGPPKSRAKKSWGEVGVPLGYRD